MFKALLRSRHDRSLGVAMCAAIAARARQPVFFTVFEVPDTIDGRFDLLTLHAWLVLEALGKQEMNDISQVLVNCLFTGFDESLRDLGVGDIGIGHRMKKMADAFYGRLSAYGTASGEGALNAAIVRNLYRGESGHELHAKFLARYALTAHTYVASSNLAAGKVDFGPLPVLDGEQ